MMNLNQFYLDAAVLARTNNWRYGQAMFNHLLTLRPDLAEKVRGTTSDPFYATDCDNFVKWLTANLTEPTESD